MQFPFDIVRDNSRSSSNWTSFILHLYPFFDREFLFARGPRNNFEFIVRLLFINSLSSKVIYCLVYYLALQYLKR